MPTSTLWRRSQERIVLRGTSPVRPSADEIEPLSPAASLDLSLPDPPPTLPSHSSHENGYALRGLGLSDAGISDLPPTLQPDHLYLDHNGAAHVAARIVESAPATSQSRPFHDSPDLSLGHSMPTFASQDARSKGHTRSGSTIADLANAAIATSPAPASASPSSHWKGASHSASRPSTSYIHRYPHEDNISAPPAKRIKSERIGTLEWSPTSERPRTSGYDDSTTMKDAMLLLSLRNEINFKNVPQRQPSSSTYNPFQPATTSPSLESLEPLNDTAMKDPDSADSVSTLAVDDLPARVRTTETSAIPSGGSLVDDARPRLVDNEAVKRKHTKSSENASKHGQYSVRRSFTPAPTSPPSKKPKIESHDPEDDVHCTACQRIEPQRLGNDERTLWIQCGPCKRWYHALCAGYRTKSDIESVNAYVCLNCEPIHGKTTYVRKSSRPRTNIDYDALNQGLVKSSVNTTTHHYIEPFKDGKFPLLPDDFARVRPELLTVEFMENFNGMKRPFVVPAAWNPRFGVQMPCKGQAPDIYSGADEPTARLPSAARGSAHHGQSSGTSDIFTEEVVDCGQDLLDMVIPRDLTVRRVAELYGPDEPVPVIDVKTQETKGQFTLQQWADYYEQPGEKPIRNVISLEVSQSPLGKLIRRPKVVRELDLEDHVWDADAEARTKKRPVQFYCLMSVADSYTDFHIDFGGSSVYYHILKGTKTFFFIPPEDKYLKKYENWCNSDAQNETWLGGQCENNCTRVDLHEGDTAFIPAGWIHSVWTPEDSLVIGGNFLTRIDYEMQLKVANIEKLTKVAAKFRYPYFQKVMWYALIKYLEEDPVPEEVLQEFREDPDYVHLRANSIYHEVEELENEAEPGSPDFNARFYPRSEVSGWPSLRDYLYRTARIDAGLPVSDITKKQVDAVRASIPKGHGEPLTMIKVFAIWVAWKTGNARAPEWVYSDGALEPEQVDKIKKPEMFRLPGERSSTRRAVQTQNQLRNSPGETPMSTPKPSSRATPKGSGLRVACEPCRKRRIKCRHKSGSDTPTRAAPEIRPRSISNAEPPTVAATPSNGTSADAVGSPETRATEAPAASDVGVSTRPVSEPGSSSKKSRSKACEECRKSKRRCVHDEHGRVDPAKAAEPSKPRGSTASKRPARLSDESRHIKHEVAISDELIDPALMSGNDVSMHEEAVVDDEPMSEQPDDFQSRDSREDTRTSETEAANLQLTKELDAEKLPVKHSTGENTSVMVDIKAESRSGEKDRLVSNGVAEEDAGAVSKTETLTTPKSSKRKSSVTNGHLSGSSATPQSRHSSRQSKALEKFVLEEKKTPSKAYTKSPGTDRRGSSAASGQTLLASGKSRRSSSNTSHTIHQMMNVGARRSTSIEASARPVSRGSTGAESELGADERFARELQAAENGLRRRTSMRA